MYADRKPQNHKSPILHVCKSDREGRAWHLLNLMQANRQMKEAHVILKHGTHLKIIYE